MKKKFLGPFDKIGRKSTEKDGNFRFKNDYGKKFSFYDNQNFQIGDNILHNEFGVGLVLGVNGEKLQVRFNKKNEIIKVLDSFVKKI